MHYILSHNHHILGFIFPLFGSFPCLNYYKMEQILGILDIIFQISQTGKYHISVSIRNVVYSDE
jgi:hypothetical protein